MEDRRYSYTFDSLATTLLAFTDALNLKRYALYVFDYGAPTGLRLAMARPDRVTAIVSQNGNAYEEGLGDAWAPIGSYWNEPSAQHRDTLREALGPAGLRSQYTDGVPNPDLIAPEGYTLDAAMIARPGNMEIQLDLFLDYANNVKLYPAFQDYFRKWKPPRWQSGENTIPSLFLPEPRPSGETTRMRLSSSWRQAIRARNSRRGDFVRAMRRFLAKALGETVVD